MVFLHSGARDFDLGGGFQHSGNYPMVFLHSGARDFDLGGGFHHSQVITLKCFNIVTEPETLLPCRFVYSNLNSGGLAKVDRC